MECLSLTMIKTSLIVVNIKYTTLYFNTLNIDF